MKYRTKERKLPTDGLKCCVGFNKERVTQPLDFAYLRYRYASHYNKAKTIKLGKPGNRNVSRTQSLFEDDPK